MDHQPSHPLSELKANMIFNDRVSLALMKGMLWQVFCLRSCDVSPFTATAMPWMGTWTTASLGPSALQRLSQEFRAVPHNSRHIWVHYMRGPGGSTGPLRMQMQGAGALGWWSFESIWNCFFFFPVQGNILLASSWHLVLASLIFSLITEFFSPLICLLS